MHSSGRTVFCIGTGFSPFSDLTREAVEAIERCSTLFFSSECKDVFDTVGATTRHCIDLSDLFEFGTPREVAYQRIGGRILDELSAVSVVGWLTRGHPGLICGVTSYLMGARQDCEVVIVPGIATIDYCLVLFPQYFAEGSFSVWNARNIVEGGAKIQNSVPAIILQACSSTTDLHTKDYRPKPPAITDLARELVKTFSEEHPVHVVAFSQNALMSAGVVTLKAMELGKYPIQPSATLVVPALRPRGETRDDPRRRSRQWLDVAFESPLERFLKKLP
ncbi:SAM-dependent methyltransferase [Sinorhizobium medicae]|uniref:SAM-dependent methyltransferase n=2 Tax=Sinorhizobium medicae TaxID=110321 RepID=UPI0023525A86|nr:SAM-dependent methyltransferase [Sinorhizobium medicae]